MKYEAHDKIYDEVDEDELYDLDKWVLMKINDVNINLKSNSKLYRD